jgi:hypothetical protein
VTRPFDFVAVFWGVSGPIRSLVRYFRTAGTCAAWAQAMASGAPARPPGGIPAGHRTTAVGACRSGSEHGNAGSGVGLKIVVGRDRR